jgi:hypothetical protein
MQGPVVGARASTVNVARAIFADAAAWTRPAGFEEDTAWRLFRLTIRNSYKKFSFHPIPCPLSPVYGSIRALRRGGEQPEVDCHGGR